MCVSFIKFLLLEAQSLIYDFILDAELDRYSTYTSTVVYH